MLPIWSLVPLVSRLYIWKFLVYVLLKPCLEDFEHNLASIWSQWNCTVIWILFGIAFLMDLNENWPFLVLWPLLSFPNLLAYWVKQFNRIILGILNTSGGIPLSPPALFVVMLPQAHLTSLSKMSSSRWMITPSWLSESLRPFVYNLLCIPATSS